MKVTDKKIFTFSKIQIEDSHYSFDITATSEQEARTKLVRHLELIKSKVENKKNSL